MHGVQYKRSVDGQVTLFRPFDLGLIINGARSNVALCDAYSGPSTAYTVNKLQPHTSYAFRLQVFHYDRKVEFVYCLGVVFSFNELMLDKCFGIFALLGAFDPWSLLLTLKNIDYLFIAVLDT